MGEVTEKQTMTLRGLVPCPTNTRLLTVCPVISIQSRSPNVFDRIFAKIDGVVITCSDITEAIKNEDELRREIEMLKKQIAS